MSVKWAVFMAIPHKLHLTFKYRYYESKCLVVSLGSPQGETVLG